MNFVKSFNMFGTDAMQIPCIAGTGAPTTSTDGAVGMLYMDTSSSDGELWKCTGVNGAQYMWTKLINEDLLNSKNNDYKVIQDVVELPTEGIREDIIYRLLTAKVCMGSYIMADESKCYCVESLPETGLPVMNAEMSEMTVYYNISDGTAYGYVDETLSAAISVPVGWYDDATLIGAFGSVSNGVVTDIYDLKDDDSFRLLLSYDYYVYKHEWTKLVFAYEKPPKFDIAWDGDMTGRTVIDMSMLGYDVGTYFVKVSDEVLNIDDMIGGTCKCYYAEENYTSDFEIFEENIDTTAYPGAFTINGWVVVVHSEEELCAALGAPAGFITNGIYYLSVEGLHRVVRLNTPKKITKIDGAYVNIDNLGLAAVAFNGDFYSLHNRPSIYTDVVRFTTNQSLSLNNKSIARNNIDVYSKSEVQTLINTAIGNAIGGSY